MEAYQSGIIRTFLFQANSQTNNNWPYQTSIADVVQAFSNLRNQADGPPDDDQGIVNGTELTLVPVDSDSLVFARTPGQASPMVALPCTWSSTSISAQLNNFLVCMYQRARHGQSLLEGCCYA